MNARKRYYSCFILLLLGCITKNRTDTAFIGHTKHPVPISKRRLGFNAETLFDKSYGDAALVNDFMRQFP